MNNPPLSVRNNNAGNLRAPNLSTARNYWGGRVKGIDDRGYVQFVDRNAGKSALYQQLGIDADRDLTLGQFLNKYTPASDDPDGNAAALLNVPSFLGVNLDTKLSDIDPDKLASAMTRQEGGKAAVDYFSAPNQRTMVRGNIDGITAVRPDGWNPATGDEMANVKAQMDLSNMGGSKEFTQFNTAPDFEKILTEAIGLRGAKDTPTVQILGIDGQTMEGSDALRALGAENPDLTATSPELEEVARKQNPAIQRVIEQNRNKRDGKYEIDNPFYQGVGLTDPRAGAMKPTTQTADTLTQPTATQPTTDTNQAPTGQKPTAEEGQSRIRSILGMLGDNPELLSALGILGQGVGGYMQSRAQDKANKRANQEQRVNNAIAAFLDRPAEFAQADTATSTGGNILGALGAALGGVGQAQMTQRAMDADRESAERIARIKAGAAGSGDADGRAGDIANALSSFDAYTGALDRAVDEGLGGEPYADFVLDIPILRRMFPEAQAAQPMFEAAALNIATAIQGSRPSEGDRIAFAMLMPQLSDSAAARQAKIRNIRELLNAAQGGSKFEEGWAVRSLQGNMGSGAGTFGSLGSAQSVMAGN